MKSTIAYTLLSNALILTAAAQQYAYQQDTLSLARRDLYDYLEAREFDLDDDDEIMLRRSTIDGQLLPGPHFPGGPPGGIPIAHHHHLKPSNPGGNTNPAVHGNSAAIPHKFPYPVHRHHRPSPLRPASGGAM